MWPGKAGEGKDRRVLQMAGGKAENPARRERESDVEKNRMEEPTPNARRTYREKKEVE